MIEMLVALATGAILMSMAVPSFQDFVADTRIKSTTSVLVAHLNAARSEAVKRGQPVSVCASIDEATCSGTTEWGSGWIVFTDSDGQPGVLDGADELLHVTQQHEDTLSLDSVGAYVRFGSLGGIDLD
jgi:type IV fimbrial biogenesis protein FimT